MKNGKILIVLCTAVFLLLAAAISCMEPAPEPEKKVNMPLSVTVVLDDRQETLDCWMDAYGDYTVFLPSGAELSDTLLIPGKDTRVVLNGALLEEAAACSGLQTETPYLLSCTAEGTTTEHRLIFLQSSGIPSLHLFVQSGTMDIIHETKGNQESGSARLYTRDGELNWSGMVEGLKGRGNSSWFKEKKPYSMTLAAEADLLGMGQAQEWILLANAMDPSHLRNKVVYDLAAKAGMAYAPECRWVDLYLNGNYAGLYLLSERNEIHPQRLDLPETGSFLVSRESAWRLISQSYPRVLLDSGAALRVHDSGLTEADIYRIWQPAENAILAEDGIDPTTGKSWQELIDVDSWAMDYLTGEIFGNVDAGTISTYFYRDGEDPSGKIYAGPVWDYDLSMGSCGTWQTQTVKAFFADKAHIWSVEDSTWYYGLNRKTEFKARIQELYQQVYRPLVQQLLDSGLEDYAAQILQSADLDRYRWKTEDIRQEVEIIRIYLQERIAFLDSLWLENTEYCRVLVLLDENSSSICHAVLPGETIPSLPFYEETWDVLGWYDAATEQPFDMTQPIYEDTVVYLKKLPGEEDSISPLQAAPIAAVLGILGLAALVDQRRRRTRKGKTEKPIAKQEIT